VLPGSKWTKQPARAFADGFHDEPAGNIMVFSDHTLDNCMSAPRENMESIICLLTEWTLKAGGHFKENSMFPINKGACAVVEDIALHLESLDMLQNALLTPLWTCGSRL